MIRAIRKHNELNGVRFSVIEFLIIALAVAPIAAIYAVHSMVWQAVAAFGIALNSLCVVAFGIDSWRHGEMGSKLRLLFNADHRRQLARDHPDLSRNTVLIAVGTLVPYAVTLLVVLDWATRREPSRPAR